jgi:hypothetical protein
MKKILIPTLVLFLMCLCASCGHKQESQAVQKEIVEVPSAQDSADIRQLTVDYLEALKAKEYDQAVGMLHKVRHDSIFDLPQEDAQKLLSQSKLFPVLRYHIDDMKFDGLKDCEVYYTIQFFEKEADDPASNSMSFGLRPRKIGDEWYLTVLTR